MKNLIFLTFKLSILCLFLIPLWTCKKQSFTELPTGNLNFTFYKPIGWRFIDSLNLDFETQRGFCSGKKDYQYERHDSIINIKLGNFTHYECEAGQFTFTKGHHYPLKPAGKIKLYVTRPHRKDSATIYILDSFYVMKSESAEINFESDTIRKILPNTIWTEYWHYYTSDSARIRQVDSGMIANGCVPLTLHTGDYHYFYVNKDGSINHIYATLPPGYYVLKSYEYTGDRNKLVNFYNYFRKKYYYVGMHIMAWDKSIVF